MRVHEPFTQQLPPDWGESWLSNEARDLVRIAVTVAGFDARELAQRLARVRSRGKLNVRTVERVLGEMETEYALQKNPQEYLGDPADPRTTEHNNFWLSPDGTLYVSNHYEHDAVMAMLMDTGVAAQSEYGEPEDWVRITSPSWRWVDVLPISEVLNQRQLDTLFDLARSTPHKEWGKLLMDEINRLLLLEKNPREDWILEDTLDRLYQSIMMWKHYPSEGKKSIRRAYEELTQEERDVLADDVLRAVLRVHGSSEFVAYRRGKQAHRLRDMDSLTTSELEVAYLGLEYRAAYLVRADDVLVHWAQEGVPLGKGVFAHEFEIVLKPGARPVEIG